MKRLPALFKITAIAFAATSLTNAAHAATPSPKAMNVLFIISDDMRTELGSYGSTQAHTPNIDRFAAQGVRFERGYCQYPLCNPSRTSMLNSRYPATSGLYGNRDWFNGVYPDWVSLPKYFRQHGYQTYRTGKIFHGNIDDAAAWSEGGEPHSYGAQKLPELPTKPLSDDDLKKHGRSIADGDRIRSRHSDRWEAVEGEAIPTTPDTLIGDKALEYLRKQKPGGAPFFIACGFEKPHSPLVAPKAFFDLYPIEKIQLPVDFAPRPTVPKGFPAGSIRAANADLFIHRDASPEEARAMIRAYLACVSYVDWNVGRVLAELDRLGLRDSTIVIFWSDHGYQLGEKGKWSKAGSLWEQGTRVPFIIYDPRAKGNGHTSPRVVEALDFYPTLVELTGLPKPTGIEGRSLVPLLNNPDAAWDHPAYTVWSEHNRGITGVAVRTERWRYAEFFGRGAGAMLTDPINDPHELTNLVDDPKYRDVVAELSALARKHVAGKTEPTPSK